MTKGTITARLGTVIATVVACAVVAAPGAVAAPATPDGGATPNCPAGYLGTTANATSVGVAVPGKVEEQPKSGALPGAPMGGNTSTPRFGELVGTGCFRRDADEVVMRFSWKSIGRVYSGTFVYQLYDCTTGRTSDALTRRLGYQKPAGTSDSAVAIVAVDPSHTYRMKISGSGAYARTSDGFTGLAGYWDVVGNPKWASTTGCA